MCFTKRVIRCIFLLILSIVEAWIAVSKGKGVEAYTLIVVEHGADEEVLKELMALEGIAEASLIYGKYDIHCKIKVNHIDKIKEIIKEIRKLNVITTETFIVYERAYQKSCIRDDHIRRLGETRASR
jgi:DNA-binding Lrp family transcriptional regulator